jgi:nitroreductase
MEVIQAIKSKRSVRSFSDQEVPEEVIRQILDAGRRAQSSRNSQPWTFVVVRQRDRLHQLSACGAYAQPLSGAGFGVVLASSVEWAFDIGQAAAYLQLAGWSLGVSSCLVWLGDTDQARILLGAPQSQRIEMTIAFGYAKSTQAVKGKSGGRKPFDEVVRWERWESA